jgi:hypothetical protein
LRAILFFILAKMQRPACGRQAQRNCGPLGLTAEGLSAAAEKLCAFPTLRDLFFFFLSQSDEVDLNPIAANPIRRSGPLAPLLGFPISLRCIGTDFSP